MFLGIDICSTARLKRALDRSPFLREEIFSPAEVAYCAGAAVPEQHLAARWAAKEACLKALGLGVLGYDLSQLEVVHRPSGQPELAVRSPELRADMERVIGSSAFQTLLSISHETEYSVACVMVTP
jgi:holo-[acyl-carrier protein] synthase